MARSRKKFTPKGMTCDCVDMFRSTDMWMNIISGKVNIIEELIKNQDVKPDDWVMKSIHDDTKELLEALRYMSSDCKFSPTSIAKIRELAKEVEKWSRGRGGFEKVKDFSGKLDFEWEKMLTEECSDNGIE